MLPAILLGKAKWREKIVRVKKNFLIVLSIFIGFIGLDYLRYRKVMVIENLIQTAVFAFILIVFSFVFKK